MSNKKLTDTEILIIDNALTTIAETKKTLVDLLDTVVDTEIDQNITLPNTDLNAFTLDGENYYRGTTVSAAKAGYLVEYGVVDRDCDPLSDGSWLASSRKMEDGAVINGYTVGKVTGGTVVPKPPVTDTAAVSDGQIEFAAKTGIIDGDDWGETAAGLKWNGKNRYSVNSTIDSGTVSYTMTLPAGNYVVAIKGRAATKTAGRNDLHNDVWVQVEGVVGWRKHYFSGSGSWATSTTAEIGHDKEPNAFSIATAGTYTLMISGRSEQAEVAAIYVKGGNINTSSTTAKV